MRRLFSNYRDALTSALQTCFHIFAFSTKCRDQKDFELHANLTMYRGRKMDADPSFMRSVISRSISHWPRFAFFSLFPALVQYLQFLLKADFILVSY